MSFVSWSYVGFVAVLWILFFFARPTHRPNLLLLASYVFYAAWSIPFLGLILLTTSVDFICARKIFGSTDVVLRKRLLALGVCSNLAVLCVFKYTNFLLSMPSGFLALFGVSVSQWHFDVILPLGISFYTFEAISYLVDVYRGQKPAHSWLSYNFYIMFFPHLIAGPIVRFNRFYPQYVQGLELPSLERVSLAFELILRGFIFKLVFADGIALVSRDLLARAATLSVVEAFLTACALGIQLFFDFQGYTHIARGTAYLFNIELPINFRDPEHSGNIAQFWQRWNITLSKWLYDYVYLPLGGGKKSVRARMMGAFFTMVIAGIWHGSGWNFVWLGVYFGVLVAIYHAYRSLARKHLGWQKVRTHAVYKVAACVVTQYALMFAAVLFNANLQVDWLIIQKMLPFGWGTVAVMPEAITPAYWGMLVCIVIAALGHSVCRPLYDRTWNQMPSWLRVQSVTPMVLVCAMLESQQTDMSFIYAQF